MSLRYRFFVGAVILVLSLFPHSATSGVAPDIAGTKCATVGAKRIIQRVSYTCVVAANKGVWRKSSTSTTSTSTTSTSSTAVARRTPGQVVADKINTYVAPMRTRNQLVPTIEYRFGPSVSEEDRTMTRQLVDAFFKYGSFPQLASYRSAISVSLSDEEAVETTSPWINISTWGSIAGGYTGSGTYALVIQNYTSHRCGRGVPAVTCAANGNGGSLGLYRTRVNVLHEFSHAGKVALMGYDPTQGNNHLYRLPMWFASGISNVQGAMILAVLYGVPYSNPNISVTEARRCSEARISLVSLIDFQTAGGGCKGAGTGDFANEVLVARFGLDKVLEFVAGSREMPLLGTWSNWSSAWTPLFERLFLQSPASFEQDVETYRNAVLNSSDLPAGFLDAKTRP